MEEKKCFKCNQTKPLTDFYKHPQMKDGRVNKCKECNKKDVQKNYRGNKEYYQEYDRKRNEKRWEYKTEQCKEWRKKNPEKYRAHCDVNNALRSGKLSKEICRICNDPNTHAHHEDYSKTLDVIWLCPQHHRDVYEKGLDVVLAGDLT